MPELACAGDLVVRVCLQAPSEHRCASNSSALRCFLVCTRVHDGGDTGMADDSAVVERGVLTSDVARWELAVQRAGVIGRLAQRDRVSVAAADEAAAKLGVSRRQVYELVKRWRVGEGLTSDLLPGKSSGGRGGERLADEVEAVVRNVLRTRYLTRQRRSVASICREITRECKVRGLRAPSRGGAAADREAGPGEGHDRAGGPRPGAGPTVGRWCPAAGDGCAGAGADRSHAGGCDRGRRAPPPADRPPVCDGGDRRGQPLRARVRRHVGGAVGVLGWVVSGAYGDRQAGLAGAAGGGGGVADARQAP